MKKWPIIVSGLYIYLELLIVTSTVWLSKITTLLPQAFDDFLEEYSLEILGFLLIGPIVLLLITAIFYVVRGIKGSNTMTTSDAVSLMKTMLIMRLIQIPGYIVLFFLATIFLMTIFTIGFSIILIILDVISIVITGMISVPVYMTLRKNGLITKLRSTLSSILSFMFVLDVFTAISCYRKVKKNSSNCSLQL